MKASRFMLLICAVWCIHHADAQTSLPVLGCNCGPRSKYHLLVTLNNDSVLKIKSRVEKDDALKSYFLFDEEGSSNRRIYPTETKHVEVLDYKNYKMTGTPADTAWLFNTDSGKIITYYTVPVYQSEQIVAFRFGKETPLIPATSQNLLLFLSTDPKAKRLAEKSKLYRAIKLFNLGD